MKFIFITLALCLFVSFGNAQMVHLSNLGESHWYQSGVKTTEVFVYVYNFEGGLPSENEWTEQDWNNIKSKIDEILVSNPLSNGMRIHFVKKFINFEGYDTPKDENKVPVVGIENICFTIDTKMEGNKRWAWVNGAFSPYTHKVIPDKWHVVVN
jgi:hypothetical protein